MLYFSIAIYYAGGTFIKNMDIAIAANPGNGMDNTPFYMLPGDHFTQFYRYSLPKANFPEKNLYTRAVINLTYQKINLMFMKA